MQEIFNIVAIQILLGDSEYIANGTKVSNKPSELYLTVRKATESVDRFDVTAIPASFDDVSEVIAVLEYKY